MEKSRWADRRSAILLKLLLLLLANGAFLFLNRWEEGTGLLLLLLLILVAWNSVAVLRAKDLVSRRKSGDFTSIFLVLILLWGCGVTYGNVDPILYPSPMRIMALMAEEFFRYLDNLAYSMSLMLRGFALAFVLGFPLGLFLACRQRLRLACASYIKILALLPSLALLPYAVAELGFRYASVSILFYSMFWKILQSTMSGVLNLDPNYSLTAQLLGISKGRYLRKILIPGIMPAVLSGINGCISAGFVVLIASEMIGSSRGLGYYIKYFSMFINYHKIIVGILYLGITVCMVTWLFERLQAAILYWQVHERRRSFHEVFGKIRPSDRA